MSVSFLDLVSLRSFSSIWYWLFVAALWSHVLHVPAGVAQDTLRRAQAGRAGARAELAALTAAEANRHLRVSAALGPWRVAAWAFVLSALAVLAAGYRIEIAQAVLLMALPLAAVRWMVSAAMPRLAAEASDPDGTALCRSHLRLRRRVQAVGLAAIFITALYGMLHNLAGLML